jgi:hypothetical protein
MLVAILFTVALYFSVVAGLNILEVVINKGRENQGWLVIIAVLLWGAFYYFTHAGA